MSFALRLLFFVFSITAVVAFAVDGTTGVATAMTALGLTLGGGMVGGFVGAALYVGVVADPQRVEDATDGEEEAAHVVFQSTALDR